MRIFLCLAMFAAPARALCTDCVNVRVGPPEVVRGPTGADTDNVLSEIRLANGGWRGFTANSITYAVDSIWPTWMGAAGVPVLWPGPPGSDSECGRWVNDTEKIGNILYGFVHIEKGCGGGGTHKAMELACSTDQGSTWTTLGKFLSGTDSPNFGTITGEGDCTVTNGGDGYLYAYCGRYRDWSTIVARVATSAIGASGWRKYYNPYGNCSGSGCWTQLGRGGDATRLDSSGGPVGSSTGRWTDQNAIVALTSDQWFHGVKASFSTNKTSFQMLSEPLIYLDGNDWSRADHHELMAYLGVQNLTDGNNQITSPFLMSYMYLNPDEGFDQRYLVFRQVTMWTSVTPATPKVGVALARWSSPTELWATTGPATGDYTLDTTLGYVMTKQHPTKPSGALEDCVSDWPGHPDHLLTNDGQCEAAGYKRLRTVGWVYDGYQTQPPNTVPVYRCYDPTGRYHYASNYSNCEGHGTMEWRLGYALQ